MRSSLFIRSAALGLAVSLTALSSACSAQEQGTSVAAPDQPPVTATVTAAGDGFVAPDAAWRDLDPENTLYVETDYGRIIIELYPEIAPRHVTQVKTLTRQKFYDFITFHRVIDGFMNQTGDPKGDGTGNSSLPDLEAEFSFRRGPEMGFTLLGARAKDSRNPNAGEIGVGFYKGLQIATQPSSQAILTKDGKVEAYGLHCKGVTSMARATPPNSANSQFFLMRGTANWLDSQYSVWGTTVWGREHLTKFKVGSKTDDPNFVPDKMNSVRVVADLPEDERVNIQVLKVDSPAFRNFLKTQKTPDGGYPDICDIEVPTRIKP